MYIDIHRHSSNKGNADIVVRNLYPNENNQINTAGYYSIGLHPWHLNESEIDAAMDIITKSAVNNSVIAIGETGIDKAIKINIKTQNEVFLKHIDIAKQVDKPIIIHCVKAYNEILKIRKESQHKKPWIIHWYNASPEMGFDLISKGCYLSFGLTLFKKDSKAFKTFLLTPLENIFFETDDPNLSIIDVYKKASEIKQIKLNDLQNQIKDNFYNCFGISL
jgi:TatD DNase family protein